MDQHLLLTARRNVTTADWWAGVAQDAATAPAALRPLLDGETQVPVSRGEADEALAWAFRQPGWTQPQPIFLVEWERP